MSITILKQLDISLRWMPKNSQKEIWGYLSIWWNLEIKKEIRSEVIRQYKTIYFIYNADGGLFNELNYWYKKHIKKTESVCELCDISHHKYFVRPSWLRFIRRLKKEYRVKVLHRDEVPQKIKQENFSYPSVIGETTDNGQNIFYRFYQTCHCWWTGTTNQRIYRKGFKITKNTSIEVSTIIAFRVSLIFANPLWVRMNTKHNLYQLFARYV